MPGSFDSTVASIRALRALFAMICFGLLPSGSRGHLLPSRLRVGGLLLALTALSAGCDGEDTAIMICDYAGPGETGDTDI